MLPPRRAGKRSGLVPHFDVVGAPLRAAPCSSYHAGTHKHTQLKGALADCR